MKTEDGKTIFEDALHQPGRELRRARASRRNTGRAEPNIDMPLAKLSWNARLERQRYQAMKQHGKVKIIVQNGQPVLD